MEREREGENGPSPRLGPVDPERMSPAQRALHDRIATGPRGGVRGPLAVWLHRPEFADCVQALGRYCRFDSSLPPRLSELAIMVTATEWRAGYEWNAHETPARAAGLADSIIDALRRGEEPAFAAEDEAAVYAFARELYARRGVSQAVYDRAAAALGATGVVDLVGILGYYALISMTINVFEIPGGEEVFATTD